MPEYKEVQIGPKKMKIPKDWSLETFSDVISTLESGGRPKTDERSENDSVLSIGGAHISSEGEFKLSEPVRISEEYYSKMNSGKINNFYYLVVDPKRLPDR